MRLPDFVIAGTQKAGTTWLRDNLFTHPEVSGCRHQLHFFDRNYAMGLEWYARQFERLPAAHAIGEKSTEYFDTITADEVARRLASDCPDTKVIIILREPAARAISAFKHMVVSGVEPLPASPDAVLFADRERPQEQSNRYIERGFYLRQLEAFYKHIPRDQILVLIFEEDIVKNPQVGLKRALTFLGVNNPKLVRPDTSPANARRLSRAGIRMMNMCWRIPYARSMIWRLDVSLPLPRWQPEFSSRTYQQLNELFRPEKTALYDFLGYRIASWDRE